MKKKVYAVLINRHTGEGIRSVELHNAIFDDYDRISARVYETIKRKMFKLGHAGKGRSWVLRTEDGKRDTFGGYPCLASFVRFE